MAASMPGLGAQIGVGRLEAGGSPFVHMERADAVVVMPVDELANQSPGSGSFRSFTLLVVPVGLTRWDGGRVTLTASRWAWPPAQA
jgi:hypothetical protein